jgi:hypothetical protein
MLVHVPCWCATDLYQGRTHALPDLLLRYSVTRACLPAVSRNALKLPIARLDSYILPNSHIPIIPLF